METRTGNCPRLNRSRLRWLALACVSLGLGLLGVACGSPAQRRAALSLFFDGVPEEGAAVTSPNASQCYAHKEAVKTASYVVPEADPRAHVPFRDGKCKNCHDALLKPVKSISDLCFTCHKVEAVVPENAHAPVAGGSCAACHVPHTGPNENLLSAAPPVLCKTCHGFEDSESVARHKLLKDNNTCTECHNGHGGDGPAFLKTPTFALCGRCHDLEFAKVKGLHSPAEGGECYECHTKHGTGKRKLLVEEGEKLCFGCHESKELKARSSHPRGGLTNCTKCHDPHGTGRPFMLRSGPMIGAPMAAPVTATEVRP